MLIHRLKDCLFRMLTYSKVQISNIAVKIASFLLLSTLAYQFKDYDLARGIVSSTNAVGIIMIFLAPILVRELSRGQNFLNGFVNSQNLTNGYRLARHY